MPLYDFACADGHHFDRFVKLEDFDAQQSCGCGALANRMLSAPRIASSDDIEPCMGMDGKMHTSLASYRATLLPSGNPKGERYTEVGNERVKGERVKFDRKQRVEDIKAAISDVKNGNVAPPVVCPVA